MPDMQTALTKAPSTMSVKEMNHVNNLLNTWAEEESTTDTQAEAPKIDHRIKNNISRITFDLIRDNPGITRLNARTRLIASGHKDTSITSLITQFTAGGLVRRDGEKLYVTQNEYKSVYVTPKMRREALKKSKAEARAKAKAAKAMAVEPVPVPAPPVERPEPAKPSVFISRHVDFDPKKIIGTLSVYHAIELHNELKKMFGA